MHLPSDEPEWHALLRAQHGAVSRAQLIARGLTRADIRAQLVARRWQLAVAGIYVTFTGPLPALTVCWIALLHAGAGAVLSHATAGALWGVAPRRALYPVHVTVPRPRGARSRRGLLVHRAVVAPVGVGSPPRTTVSVTAVDLCSGARRPSEITALLGQVAQRYPDAVSEAIALVTERRTLRWRAEILAAARDVVGGAHSELERRYLVDVEQAHGLPTASRQRAVGGYYRDVYYDGYSTAVELDGRAVHGSVAASRRDRRRDRLALLRGEVTLRFDWNDVRHRPCAVAAEVSVVLRSRGWQGRPRACSRGCRVGELRG